MTVQSSAAAQDPILCAKILADLRSFDGFHEIAREFLAEAPVRITAIRQALAEIRLDVLALQAHALKGASGATGALRLSQAAANLEIASRSNAEKDLLALIEDVAEQFEMVRVALLELIANEPQST